MSFRLDKNFVRKWSTKLILSRQQEGYLFNTLHAIKIRAYWLLPFERIFHGSNTKLSKDYEDNFLDAEIQNGLIHAVMLNDKDLEGTSIRLQSHFTEIINILIRYNLRLVISVARRKYVNKGIDMQDLLDEGVIGLLIAIGKFDYRLNCKFSTYSIHWIKQRMFRCLNEGLRPVKLPMHIVSTLQKIQEDDFDVNETDEEKYVRKRMSYLPRKKISLDANSESKDYDLPSLQDTLVDKTILSDYQDFKQKQNRQILVKKLAHLKPQEERILRLKFGISNKGIYTTQEIARILGMEVSEMNKLETSITRKLKQKCKKNSRK